MTCALLSPSCDALDLPRASSPAWTPPLLTETYDASGQLLAQTNGANQSDSYSYDSRGRLIRSTDGRGDVTRRVYDAAGNLIRLTDPAGNATTYAYDRLDRLSAETTASGARQTMYDASGNVQYAVDRNGRAMKYLYRRDDLPTKETWYADLAAAQAVPASNVFAAVVDTFYDDLGRVTERQQLRRTSANLFDYRATDSYRYDGLDRVTEHTNGSLYDATKTPPARRRARPTPTSTARRTPRRSANNSGRPLFKEQF